MFKQVGSGRATTTRHPGGRFTCDLCPAGFNRPSKLVEHKKNCIKNRTCARCDKVLTTVSELKEHMSTHNIRKRKYVVNNEENNEDNNEAKRLRGKRCRICNYICEDGVEFYQHRMSQHGGQHNLQDFEHELENDEDLRHVYNVNRLHILANHDKSNQVYTYNFPTNDLDGGISDISDQLRAISADQNNAFKINLSLGMILRNSETGRFKYFIPYENETVLSNPYTISRDANIRPLTLKLKKLDIRTYVDRHSPDSSWKPFMVTNIVYRVYPTGFPLGNGELPDYIKQSHVIISLEKNSHNIKYNDNLCAFRALAHHYNQRQIEISVRIYYDKWMDFIGREVNRTDFRGLELSQLPDFEKCFELNINVYELQESGTVIPRYRSLCHFGDTMYLNLFEHHLSFIKDFKTYAKKFQCPTCERHFNQISGWKRHLRSCSNVTKFMYPGGFLQRQKTVFDELAEYGINVPDQERFFPYFMTFDCESMLEQIRIQASEQLVWTQKHKPTSVSLCSNVPQFTEPECIIDKDLDILLKNMASYMTQISKKTGQLTKAKWKTVITQLKKMIRQYSTIEGTDDEVLEETLVDDNEDTPTQTDDIEDEIETDDEIFIDDTDVPQDVMYNDLESVFEERTGQQTERQTETQNTESHNPNKYIKQRLCELYGKFMRYCEQVPVLSFNGGKYDLNLLKSKLAKHLNLHNDNTAFVIKKPNNYTCISTENFKFLDVTNYLAPGFSYATFLRAFEVDEKKGFFPYEWFDSIEKLDNVELPPYDKFYSDLKKVNILDIDGEGQQNYEWLQEVWRTEGMTTFRDFLKWYNNLDVQPFVQAVENMQQFYKDKNIDLFKIAISVPGIARKLLFDSTNANFPLFSYATQDIFKTIKKSCFGGPSIIFTRRHKVNETFIRNNPDKVCKAIRGEDANALYVKALQDDFGTGCFVDRKGPKFKPEPCIKFMPMYFWMDFIMKRDNILIKHRLNNNNKECRIGPYPVDGLCGATKTVYEFHGCYYHGHECELTKTCNEKWQKRRPELEKRTQDKINYLKQLRYNVIEIRECEYQSDIEPHIEKIRDQYLPQFYRKNKHAINDPDDMLRAIIDEELFGLIEVDIHVPEKWNTGLYRKLIVGNNPFTHSLSPKEYFSEMSPIFCTSAIPFESFGPHMQEHVKKHDLSEEPRTLLVGGLSASRILLSTSLVKWYLEHGLEISKIYRVIEFTPQKCFKKFADDVCDARRAGDLDPLKAIIADTMKLHGNSAFGGLLLDKEKHRDVKYVEGERAMQLKVNDPRFRHCTPLDDGLYEIEMSKARIKMDMPNYLGFFILNNAKLHLLKYYYDCLDFYVDRSNFELTECDTDSLYYGISQPNFIDVVKPHLREEFNAKIFKSCHIENIEADGTYWYPRQCCDRHKKFDRRTPGLFKLEATGTEMISLSSKTYLLSDGDKYKLSSKGVQKHSVKAPLESFRSVLETGNSISTTNKGFRAKDNTMFTYEQSKKGFGYFYCKRQVLDNGINTIPLDITLSPHDLNNTYVTSNSILSQYSKCDSRCRMVFGYTDNDETNEWGDVLSEPQFFMSVYQLYLHYLADCLGDEENKKIIFECKEPYQLYNKNVRLELPNELMCKRKQIMKDAFLFKWLWCSHFREALADTNHIVFCGKNKYFTCGFKYDIARVTKLSQFPGHNVLGDILCEIRELLKDVDRNKLLFNLKLATYANDESEAPELVADRVLYDACQDFTARFEVAKSMIVKNYS